jgi:hypothetical protein
MLVLPNGQILLTNSGPSLAFYTLAVGDGPQASWMPTITGYTQNANGSYTLTGTQLNGRDEGAAYGDDEQMAENYPLVQLIDLFTGNVMYATTSNWSSNGVATGTTPETVTVNLPAGLGNAPYLLFVIADGISSLPIVQFPIIFPFRAQDGVAANGIVANPSNLSQIPGVGAQFSAGVSGSASPSLSTGNAVSLSSVVAGGSSTPPSPGSNTRLNSNTVDGPSPAVTQSSGTAGFADWLNNEEGLHWAGLNAALDLLNA